MLESADTDTRQHWCVVGGGFLGAILAAKLAKQGNQVSLFESANHIGGLADGWQVGKLHWDRFYHVILMSDARTRELLAELALESEIQWRETRTGFYSGGRLFSMSNSVEFLKFPPLTLVDKIRLAVTIVAASRMTNWRNLERVDAVSWLRRWSGQGNLEKVWKPLLRAKLGELYTSTSAAFIWSTINRMYAARRSGLKKEMFGYVEGGYQRVTDAMYEHLRSLGVAIHFGVTVDDVRREDHGLQVSTRAAQRDSSTHQLGQSDIDPRGVVQYTFDKVIVATPAPIAATLCRDLSNTERSCLSEITHLGVVCVSVVLRRPLAGYYVTNVTDDWVPFTGVIEMSALVDSTTLAGQGLVYLPKYIPPDDPLFSQSDDIIAGEFVAALLKMYPSLTTQDVVDTRVARARHVMAVPTLNYSTKVPQIKTSVDGLYTANAAQILFGTLNINEIGLLADRVFSTLNAAGATDR